MANITNLIHGMCYSPTYISWNKMLQRCNNPKNPSYEWYGKIGIRVCDHWKDFRNFLEDMGERPEGMSLERINSNKDYYKENCKWATQLEQIHNRKNAIWITFEGMTMHLTAWINLLGINKKVLVCNRISAGWSFVEAVTLLPLHGRDKRFKAGKSGVRGVSYNKHSFKWRVNFGINGKNIVKEFFTKKEAIAERRRLEALYR